MSSDVVISVRGLSKTYEIGHRGKAPATLTEAVLQSLRRGIRKEPRETFVAVDNVSFDVMAGEALGIVGRNGAGKSTLLKILTRITPPSAGEATVAGRIGSLLEVGTGFHPDLSGRENIFLNGTILGMRRREVASVFDEIVEFAGVDKFLDTPVKRYSSGMYVRLAFAVAAHLRSDILIVDEVLAVGDAEFQRRCLGSMQEAARSGRTVLFVTHHLPSVAALCDRCLLIDRGRVAFDGPTSLAIEKYLGGIRGDPQDPAERPGSGRARAIALTISKATFLPKEQKAFGVTIRAQSAISALYSLVSVRDRLGNVVASLDSRAVGVWIDLSEGETLAVTIVLRTPWLLPGRYVLDLGLLTREGEPLDAWADAAEFAVTELTSDADVVPPEWGLVWSDYTYEVAPWVPRGHEPGRI